MNDNLDKKDPKNWTKEEMDRVVGVFQWLIEQDKKQNPERYKRPAPETRQSDIIKKL